MRRGVLFALALAILITQPGCSLGLGSELAQQSNRPVAAGEPGISPQAQGQQDTEAILYFQYSSEAYLSSESRSVTVQNSESLEEALVRALIAGPSAESRQLQGVINTATRVISVREQNGCYFVTLSEEFLSPPEALPTGWQEDPAWRELAGATQRLAVYSVVNTLLSLGRARTVQFLIASGEGEAARRPTWGEMGFTGENRDQQIGGLTLNTQVILTSRRILEIVFAAINERSWARVERFVAAAVPDRSVRRPERAELIAELETVDFTVLDYSFTDIMAPGKGQMAVCSTDITLHRPQTGEKTVLTDLPVTLVWEDNGWKMSYSSLVQIMKGGAR